MTHIVRVLAVLSSAILVLAGCAELPKEPACPVCPAPPRPLEAAYEQAPFTAIPGWADADLAAGLRAFAAGCGRMAAGSALRRACDAARALPANDGAAARAFLESAFDAWKISAVEGKADGMVTCYY